MVRKKISRVEVSCETYCDITSNATLFNITTFMIDMIEFDLVSTIF